ncbi:MAG: hypothetical protein HY043_14360 [Verrucomicrobia bacterium]|nr:hypothetical protein [Verrucomicrobiota bacterium]
MKFTTLTAPTVNAVERARAYLARIPGAISGSGGHAATFHVACVLVNGFDLSTDEALSLFSNWNAVCQPPWSEAELRHKLTSALRSSHTKPRGHLLGDAQPVLTFRPARITPALAPVIRPFPDRSGFAPGTTDQIQRLASMRPYHREGLEWASERGLLVFGQWRGFDCYGVTDASGRVLELRRMDGDPFPAVPGTSLVERKSHSVKGSQKQWPLGIIEDRKFAAVALVEGLPDFLTGHHVSLWEQASHHTKRDARCVPVAMLSSSPEIHADALALFRGKHVRIFAHAEGAGLIGAAKWQAQLQAVSSAIVDVFDFSAYRKTDGSPVNDLWEFVHELHPDDQQNPVTWRILP